MPQWLCGNALCNIADRLAALDENVYYLSKRACLNGCVVTHCNIAVPERRPLLLVMNCNIKCSFAVSGENV